jgi:hypothetical protein
LSKVRIWLQTESPALSGFLVVAQGVVGFPENTDSLLPIVGAAFAEIKKFVPEC